MYLKTNILTVVVIFVYQFSFAQINILPMGDSFFAGLFQLTEIWDDLETAGLNRTYEGTDANNLLSPYTSILIGEEGDSGKRMDNVIPGTDLNSDGDFIDPEENEPLSVVVAAISTPDIVYLQLGINDLVQGYIGSHTQATVVNGVITAFNNIVQDLDAAFSGVNIIATTVTPVKFAASVSYLDTIPEVDGINSYIDDYNANLLTSVSTLQGMGINLSLIDNHAIINANTATLISSDGLHPTAAGYQAMAALWSSETLNIVPEPRYYSFFMGFAVLALIFLKNKR